jgi:uncharacterized protein
MKGIKNLLVLSIVLIHLSSYATDLIDGTAAAKSGDFGKAERLWSKAAAAGNADASYNLAGLYLSGALGKPNFKKAIDLLKQSSEAGNSMATVGLGHLYLNGIGVTADAARASNYFQAAAAAGNTEGKYHYAVATIKTSNDSVALKQALVYLQESSAIGYPPAQHAVGDMLITGSFVGKNIDRAIEYYKNAASAGYAPSAFTLGELYLNGNELPRDFPLAKVWLSKAEQLGSSDAAYMLGYLIIQDASPSTADLKKAYGYFLSAAHDWNEKAQEKLGFMIYNGLGTEKNFVQAYKWLELSASTGYEDSHYLRALVAKSMTPRQIDSAKKLARDWFEKNHDRPHTHKNSTVTHTLK